MSGSSWRGHRQQLVGNKAFLTLAPCRTADDRTGSVYKMRRRLATAAFWVTWVIYVRRAVSVGLDVRAPVADLARA